MKKVRFESPVKVYPIRMDDFECHSPRPFIEKQETFQPDTYCFSKPLLYNPDPVHRFENSNSSPYPLLRKTSVVETESRFLPSNDLNLSILDGSSDEPRRPILCNKQLPNYEFKTFNHPGNESKAETITPPKVLSPIENVNFSRPAPKNDSNNFFIRRSHLDKFHIENATPLQDQLNRLSLSKENVHLAKKSDMLRLSSEHNPVTVVQSHQLLTTKNNANQCSCSHCSNILENAVSGISKENGHDHQCHMSQAMQQSICRPAHCASCKCSNCSQRNYATNPCNCNSKAHSSPQPFNLVDKKTWMLKKYQQNDESNCMEVDKQQNVKEKREPTVADLFKIIKLQNEQLKLLQEKVDKYLTGNNYNNNPPIHNIVTEQVAIDSEQHKISIGVMTSFEMVRTSTVINKEIVKQTSDNAQIHCNNQISQISIKEVVSKTQPITQNFLDGIAPVGKAAAAQRDICTEVNDINDDKTLNDLSLYNVQVDNATTPLISPEQSLYLDVRDYSDSESGSDDQSNVGWTYYNKVMTHVNGMLQDSDIPSSASALYRNTRQQCVQMHIDKTNVSVTKRVKFGDDPLGIQQPHIYAAPTDVSLKMNQLAAKYLSTPVIPIAQNPIMVPREMSFATKNYMERHRILQGDPRVPAQYTDEIPRFLDITALKQQPKLL